MLERITNAQGHVIARVYGDTVTDNLGTIVFYLREDALLDSHGNIAARLEGNLILSPQGQIIGYHFDPELILTSGLGQITGRLA